MTNSWTDIRNTDLVVIMGGNAAEAHPCGFKWVTEAKANRGAKLVVVDPRFTRSASVADFYAPIRQGTDIAFLLGVIRHCINGEKACHKMSQLDASRYDANAVDTKIAQLKNGGYGPTTCAKFEAEGSTHCKECKWKGKVGSPITLA